VEPVSCSLSSTAFSERLELEGRGDELVLTIAAPEEAAPVARDLASSFGD
jgi:hypothetical protein